MINMAETIAPKSNQLNADDLIGGPRTIRITRVALSGAPDQPIAMNFEGDNGKPYLPGKSMRRVLFQLWGQDGNTYVGRRMTIYRDDKVIFGGVEVGGIRISHMSNIKGTRTLALTASKTQRKPFVVQPLPDEAPLLDVEMLFEEASRNVGSVADYQAFWSSLTKVQKEALLPQHEGLKATAKAADDEADMQAANEPVDDELGE